MEKKPGLFFFKRLGGGGGKKKKGSLWNCWGKLKSSGFRWRSSRGFQLWFVDGFLFKIVSVFEAIFLVANLCFFYLCCGCHI